MTTIPDTPGTVSRPRLQGCSASGNVTRSLLGYLALAGPLYIAVSLAPRADPAGVQPHPR